MRLLSESTVELFAEYGLTVTFSAFEKPDLPMTDPSLAGVIGFSHTSIRGSLTLLMEKKMVSMTRLTAVGADESDTAQQDWMAELANQLLGRKKNKMLRYSTTLGMSTPTVISGKSITISPPRSRDARWLKFSAASGVLHVLCDCGVREGLELTLLDSHESVSAEGDLLLF